MASPNTQIPVAQPYRLADPPLTECAACQTTRRVKVVSRLDYVVYMRCSACGAVWSVSRPAPSYV